jgi:hypothetical protein
VIFNIQTIRLQRALASHFEFAFLDAPVGAPPGEPRFSLHAYSELWE